jgi:hypothetical protein
MKIVKDDEIWYVFVDVREEETFGVVFVVVEVKLI